MPPRENPADELTPCLQGQHTICKWDPRGDNLNSCAAESVPGPRRGLPLYRGEKEGNCSVCSQGWVTLIPGKVLGGRVGGTKSVHWYLALPTAGQRTASASWRLGADARSKVMCVGSRWSVYLLGEVSEPIAPCCPWGAVGMLTGRPMRAECSRILGTPLEEAAWRGTQSLFVGLPPIYSYSALFSPFFK